MNIDQQVLQIPTLLTKIVRMLQIKVASVNFFTRASVDIMPFIILLLLVATAFTTSTQAATLLFKSNFGPGVSIAEPTNYFPTGNGAWQYITGTDQETGYTWPISALGAEFSGVQLITREIVDSSTIGNHITNHVRSVTGPKGKPVNELFQNVKLKEPAGQAFAQAPLLIKRPWTKGDVKDLYLTYWFKYPADFASKLTLPNLGGNWRTQFEFKTGGYNNQYGGDYRIITNIIKDSSGKLYWSTVGDNKANQPEAPVQYWREANNVVPVPIDKWFKYEVYWHRSSGSDGRFWSAVNGQVIVDRWGPNMGKYNLPITRIMANNAYTGGYATVESHSTGLQIWDGFPCGVGRSCYNYDQVAPTVPASLKSTIAKYSSSANVSLTWAASADNVSVAGYAIYRNGTKVGVTNRTRTSFSNTISGSAKGALYSYTVRAFDAEGNLSDRSNYASVVY